MSCDTVTPLGFDNDLCVLIKQSELCRLGTVAALGRRAPSSSQDGCGGRMACACLWMTLSLFPSKCGSGISLMKKPPLSGAPEPSSFSLLSPLLSCDPELLASEGEPERWRTSRGRGVQGVGRGCARRRGGRWMGDGSQPACACSKGFCLKGGPAAATEGKMGRPSTSVCSIPRQGAWDGDPVLLSANGHSGR